MPKANAKKSHSKDSDEEMPASTQSHTQAEKAAASMDRADTEKCVNDLVQYLLIMDQKKLPIKKIDINKNVLKENSRAFPVLIKSAADKLLKVFGIELLALDEKFKGSYILVNRVDIDTEDVEAGNSNFIPVEWPDEDNAKTGLLMVILSFIFMNGQVMVDSQMWYALKKLGIDADSNCHEVFGDVKRLITQEFVRQGYLEYIKHPNSDPPVHDFRWGQRAKHEMSKRNCLDFVSQVYDMKPDQWTSQWNAVIEEGGVVPSQE